MAVSRARPETLAALKETEGEKEAAKLDRAPTLVVASAVLTGDLVQDEEDICAAAAAIELVLLAATERGDATYWRTPWLFRTPPGRAAAGIPTASASSGCSTSVRPSGSLRHAKQARVALRRVPRLASLAEAASPGRGSSTPDSAVPRPAVRRTEIEVLVEERGRASADDGPAQ